MEKFIIVMETNICNSHSIKQLPEILDTQPGLKSWTIDLDDDQKILRIVSTLNIEKKVIRDLRRIGVSAITMDVF